MSIVSVKEPAEAGSEMSSARTPSILDSSTLQKPLLLTENYIPDISNLPPASVGLLLGSLVNSRDEGNRPTA